VQAALEGVEGVTKAEVTKGKAVVTAEEKVEVKSLIAALKKAGFGGSEEEEEAS